MTGSDDVASLRDALAAAHEREHILRHELQHRVRNMLAVIRSVYRRTLDTRTDEEEFGDHFQGRLDALARYQLLVDGIDSSGVELEDMLRDELLEAHCLDEPQCTIDGPPVRFRQKAAELMGLAIHELATNSIKFGALAQDGRIAISWSLANADGQPALRFRWTESGISVLTPAPRPNGFGRQLIEEALPYQLGATTSFDLGPGGLDCVILLPLAGAVTAVGDQPGPAGENLALPPTQGEGTS
jgi:two-component sensor histidine kinase